MNNARWRQPALVSAANFLFRRDSFGRPHHTSPPIGGYAPFLHDPIYSRMCNMANVHGFFAEVAAEIKEHLQTYIRTDGKEGYYRDLSGAPGGGDPKSITLILRTRGRKSGEPRLAPLLYNHWKDEFVVVASKAGADEHPGWFLNMTAAKAVDIQIKNRRYRCTWRVSEGAERAKIWRFMVDYYPPFHTYQTRTQRELPVVVLTP